ncbi:MAG: prepilin-type N-terminal cleavage/methylation domain-containing protein [Lachnospiraceae bacterium]|nr:prepilin-type N-terminal cleavage/methylation domain-containing protein [Lachnospiraceae bacterium]
MRERKGFTLAELLIVVAIIAVLVAISIPIFTSQLERSRDAVTISNIRAAYAMAQTAYLTQQSDTANNVTYAAGSVTVGGVISKGTVSNTPKFSGAAADLVISAQVIAGCAALDDTPGTYTLTFTYDSDGKITAVTSS